MKRAEAEDDTDREPIMNQDADRLRFVHEALLTLNLALGVVLAKVLGGDGSNAFHGLTSFIYDQLGVRGANGAASGYLALAMWVVLLAAPLFLVLRCFARVTVITQFLVCGGGLLALAVNPVCWVYLSRRYGATWYPVEAIAFLFGWALYLYRKSSMPVWVAVSAAGLHFGFWYLWCSLYPEAQAELLLPPVGFCATVAWFLWERKQRRARVGNRV